MRFQCIRVLKNPATFLANQFVAIIELAMRSCRIGMAISCNRNFVEFKTGFLFMRNKEVISFNLGFNFMDHGVENFTHRQ